jgi:zinc/manganese transport system substrate-binding protein
MRTISTIVTALVIGLAAGATDAGGPIKVVTSTLDMADFAKNIGGDRVEVYAVFKGLTDLHFFEPVPSQVMKLKQADMLIVVGLDADVWMKSLIDASRNPRIKFGAPGYVDPSDGIRPLDVPAGRIDGSMGDVHPYGNPHYWLDPDNAKIAVANICEGLVRISPADEALFRANEERYLTTLDETAESLRAELAPFRGAGIIQYHESWNYFCGAFGLTVLASLEPKPGIPPTAKHLNDVIRAARSEGARLMLIEPYYPDKPAEYVERETGLTALRLPIYIGSVPGVSSYLDLLTYDVDAIAKGLSSRPEESR